MQEHVHRLVLPMTTALLMLASACASDNSPASCEDGERRCSDVGEIEVCASGAFVLVTACPEKTECEDGECRETRDCVPDCEPGACGPDGCDGPVVCGKYGQCPAVGIAGAPADLASIRDAPALFSLLGAHGVTKYLHTTITAEIPETIGLGFEADIFPPPWGTATSALYGSAEANGVTLYVSANLIYPAGPPFPAPANDPLVSIMDAAGPGVVGAVVSYDEPAWHGVPVAYTEALYNHVKALYPDLRVVQYHAPCPEDADPSAYLSLVLEHAAHADEVGFGIYPIRNNMGKPTPYSAGANVVDPARAVGDYVRWLRSELPGKRHAMALQAFGFRNLYTPEALAEFTSGQIAAARPPTRAELDAMAAVVADVDTVYWWGPSTLDSVSDAPWLDVLAVSADLTGTEVP